MNAESKEELHRIWKTGFWIWLSRETFELSVAHAGTIGLGQTMREEAIEAFDGLLVPMSPMVVGIMQLVQGQAGLENLSDTIKYMIEEILKKEAADAKAH